MVVIPQNGPLIFSNLICLRLGSRGGGSLDRGVLCHDWWGALAKRRKTPALTPTPSGKFSYLVAKTNGSRLTSVDFVVNGLSCIKIPQTFFKKLGAEDEQLISFTLFSWDKRHNHDKLSLSMTLDVALDQLIKSGTILFTANILGQPSVFLGAANRLIIVVSQQYRAAPVLPP
ncbi:uncharacterized protein BJ212DRAFT_1301522 [Suillus subaureus]|uniref:Uncharacterized protein n=1 Tax=Suillus subaureus TaxID=48587 RepID=A0A9P7JBD5_9AGAM|nr:uncharacterized protein BJ212DRAFT_1301522 [Suillus subaureus]KAG1812546.1 hypothetical protein BJ212DRAFT_1301522 [Suillus subaureus]